MIVQDITIICVKNLNIKFQYRPLSKPYKLYFKDYDVRTSLTIKEDQIWSVPYNSSVTILIKHKYRYYWCPQFEEIYKNYKGTAQVQEKQRKMFVMRTTIEFKDKIPTLTFDYHNVEFKTTDVKRILIKDANN